MTTPDLAALRTLVEADPAKYIAAMLGKMDDADKEAFNLCIRWARDVAARGGAGAAGERAMTNPDIAALRALVEAVGTTLPRAPRLAHAEDCGCDDPHHRRGWDSERLIELTEWRTSLGPLWIAALEALERVEALAADRDRLQQWVHDLQAGMYINCVYCGHRYGPDDEVPASMADVLKEHIEHCPKHPMSTLKARLARLEEALRVAKRTIRTWSEMGAREPEECLDETWLLYQESPEMKQINTVLEGRDE